ncbi:Membrane protein involved in aromatic hydrocarbon degradation OS=Rhodopirellula baltica SH28 GN=RBSH_00689 PE=4 SV=1: Toluene_X [Gemmataceae bacterium]|nr:Membrane protein involved in aromatic hydrocarbon degradation OS=Rhodopirellula baltica SH28 GN=RBSH_00689 PE=4 SV=1: Toluene_X [Gemmataceae bacterium]VTU00818.1 Membrane protein involved in aromatic hydrocarbon degradation OS=Rhodopirellula baltica SH28 GN=RBSH_00689 PE=4 SV=1: Toluene_X [Gemmataceae bacterium]
MARFLSKLVALALVLGAFPAAASAQPGVYLPGAGAVNGGMAGVSTATPVDALGALYWNPAAIGRLGRNEVSIGGAFVYPDIYVSSSRPRLDGTVMSGRTRSDNGFPLVPSLGVVSKLDEGSPFTFGMGLIALGGGGVNFPGDAGNPILAPTGPFGQLVLGPTFANMQLLQLNPTVSYQVTDRLVVGVGPTVDYTLVSFDPAYFAPPNQIPGQPNTFLTATDSRPFWGGGVRAGLVYSVTDTLDVGFGYTSQQWLETWQFNTRDNLGNARTLNLQATLPAIYSWGVAWRGVDRLTLGVDMRYFDYKNTDLFGTPVSAGGLGWSSAFAVALGANYQLTSRVAVRAGYQYNTNPLETTRALFNIQAPAIIQNTISVGTTVNLTEAMAVSLGYAYGFKNSITGTADRVPNTSIGLEASSQSLLFNLQVKFGGGWGRKPAAGCEACAPATPVAAADAARGDAATALGTPR